MVPLSRWINPATRLHIKSRYKPVRALSSEQAPKWSGLKAQPILACAFSNFVNRVALRICIVNVLTSELAPMRHKSVVPEASALACCGGNRQVTRATNAKSLAS